MDKIKKIIFIVVIIALVGGLIFFLLNIFTDVFTFKEAMPDHYSLSEIQEGPNFSENEEKSELEQAMESSSQSTSLFDEIESNPYIIKEQKVTSKYEKTGDLYLLNYGFQQVFDVICRKNQNWGLDDSDNFHMINMSNFLTKRMLSMYNENDGILDQLKYDNILNIWYYPYGSLLRINYTYKNEYCEALLYVDIIEEDGHQKINDINYEYIIDPNEITDIKDYPVTDVMANIMDIIYQGYTSRGDVIRDTYTITTEPTDDFMKKHPGYKILGNEFDKVYSILTYEDESKGGITEDTDACWVNIKVEWENKKENCMYWTYYKIYYTLENYKLIDVKVFKEKTLRGSSNKPISIGG